ncbi:MAG TPA: Ig-like domain-containing protein [Gemmatimonadaceae bacterium]
MRFGVALVGVMVASCTETTGPNLSGVPGYLISEVRVSPSIDTIFVPDTIRSSDRIAFSASAIGKNGAVIPAMTFVWSSSDPSIATVDSSGLVTPLRQGEVEISASADKIGNATLVILPATMRVSLEPSIDTILVTLPIDSERDTLRMTATARDLNDVLLTGVSFTWSSSDPAVAAVDATGLVSAVGLGRTNIIVSANGHQALSVVHVVAAPSPG